MGDAGHRALRRPTCGRPQPGPGDAASRIGPALPLRGHLRPGVFQGERPVEDGPPRRGIGVGAEVAEPLELDGLPGRGPREPPERRLHQGAREDGLGRGVQVVEQVAIERDELLLFFQPRVDVLRGAVIGAEVLLRWQHPGRGLVPPGEFIPVAEECGLIGPIGQWVIKAACRQVLDWRCEGLQSPRCAVNLSVRQFNVDGLVEEVVQALASNQLQADALELEITESLLMANPERALDILLQLHRLGVHIAIDDFGTGYSSLAYLKRFPAQTLKIDRSFVQDLPDDQDDATITKALIAMAHSLGMEVVAEGVETSAQLDFLREAGCDEVQGYYLGRPMAPHEIAARLLPCPLEASAA